ncbi:hypothetical protein WFP14_16855, partial [Yersinia proxima]
PEDDFTLKMPTFEWGHTLLLQPKWRFSLPSPDFCNSAAKSRICLNIKCLIYSDSTPATTAGVWLMTQRSILCELGGYRTQGDSVACGTCI